MELYANRSVEAARAGILAAVRTSPPSFPANNPHQFSWPFAQSGINQIAPLVRDELGVEQAFGGAAIQVFGGALDTTFNGGKQSFSMSTSTGYSDQVYCVAVDTSDPAGPVTGCGSIGRLASWIKTNSWRI